MGNYSMQLRTYIEMFSQNMEGVPIREKIEIGRKHLFDFPYPFFDEEYRKAFETNIIRKFYMREIGTEVEELFKFNLETWLTINMPYFNKLFESELLEYDPLMNTEITLAHEKIKDKDQKDERGVSQQSETTGNNVSTTKELATDNAEGTQTSNGTSENLNDDFKRQVSSDNPDSRLQLQTEEGKGVIEYASNITEDKVNNKENSKNQQDASTKNNRESNLDVDSKNKTNVNSSANQKDELESNINETEHFIQKRFGKDGANSYPDLIADYRASLLRIENMIHKEIQQLFMLVY